MKYFDIVPKDYDYEKEYNGLLIAHRTEVAKIYDDFGSSNEKFDAGIGDIVPLYAETPKLSENKEIYGIRFETQENSNTVFMSVINNDMIIQYYNDDRFTLKECKTLTRLFNDNYKLVDFETI